MPDPTPEITVLLNRAFEGDEPAREEVFRRVYDRLRAIANGPDGARHRQDGTLNVTSLVNETYLKLFTGRSRVWQNRTHFFAVAATAMRHIVVDHARLGLAQKRGVGWTRVAFADELASHGVRPIDIIALDDALSELSALNPRQASIVEMRFYAGMSFKEIADVHDKSTRTIELDWRTARAWLRGRLEGNEGNDHGPDPLPASD